MRKITLVLAGLVALPILAVAARPDLSWWCVQAQPRTLRAAGNRAEDQVP